MKIVLLHGAIKNAGDFLIAHRSELLVHKCYPDAEIELVFKKGGTDSRKQLSDSDLIILCGGPIFSHNVYPGEISVLPEKNEKTKLLNVGGGGVF